ncbi:MAG: DUF4864 domain-containing protein [Burkholderiales bacterium]
MKHMKLLTTLFSCLIAFHAHGQTNDLASVTDSDLAEIQSVVQQQLFAIDRNDAEMAFAFASPGVQEAFGSSDRFLFMVRRGYSALYRPRHVEFLDLTVINGTTVQPVRLVSSDGGVEVALYEMQRQSDNQWRINGCDLAKSELTSL